MKHGKKPTVAQKKLMAQFRLNHTDWLVVKDTPDQMVLVYRYSDKTTRVIQRGDI